MADGTLWGCDLFFDFAKLKKDESISRKYSFGNLDHFRNNYGEIYPEILSNHSQIRKDKCSSSIKTCSKCLDLLDCFVCPMAAAFGSKQIGIIPDWVCSIQRIIKKERKKFWVQQDSGWIHRFNWSYFCRLLILFSASFISARFFSAFFHRSMNIWNCLTASCDCSCIRAINPIQ